MMSYVCLSLCGHMCVSCTMLSDTMSPFWGTASSSVTAKLFRCARISLPSLGRRFREGHDLENKHVKPKMRKYSMKYQEKFQDWGSE